MGDQLVTTCVLLAAYNGEKHLQEQLDSLRNQTDPDFSVLIQDDGSTDGTLSLLENACREDSRFRMAGESGRGLGPAGNFLSLIRQSDADRVLLCDQDDLWEPEKIARLKQEMNRAESAWGASCPLLVHSDCLLMDESGAPLPETFFRHQGWDPAAVTLPRLLVQNNVTGCTLVMNRPLASLIAAHGKAKDLFMHDWFIALTAASFGHVVFLDELLTRYRQHGENAVGASKKGLLARGFAALRQGDKARRRILLTYTHTLVFRKLYEGELPEEADRITSAYLATRRMPKLRRVREVRRLGCTMQSPVTRMGQIIFG
jgi:glycosyltransferase involved in cell wall biosynthesis